MLSEQATVFFSQNLVHFASLLGGSHEQYPWLVYQIRDTIIDSYIFIPKFFLLLSPWKITHEVFKKFFLFQKQWKTELRSWN